MKQFKIFYLTENYYDHLFNNKKLEQMLSKELRPHINLVGINLNNVDYLIPLSSDNDNKYKPSHKYSFVILDEKQTKTGILKINKMIPVLKHEKFVYEPSINQIIDDHGLHNPVFKSLEFLNKPENQKQIHQLAKEVYEKRCSASKEQLNPNSDQADWNLITAVDFEQAEMAMMEFAFKLKLDEGYILQEWANYTSNFSELNEYCRKNEIDENNRFELIDDSQIYELCLIKHKSGVIEMIYESWPDELDEETHKYYAPYIVHKEEVKNSEDVFRLIKNWDFDTYVWDIDDYWKKELIKDIKEFLKESEQKQVSSQNR